MNPSDPYFWEWMVLELQVCLNTIFLLVAIAKRWGREAEG